MIIFGDLACPNKDSAGAINLFFKKNKLLNGKLVLCNLEGVIRDDEPYEDEKLFNHSTILDVFKESNVVFSLANNHMYDYPDLLNSTVEKINKMGFVYNGLTKTDEISPTIVSYQGKTYAFFCHCWKIYTRTNPNKINDIRVCDYDYDVFTKAVRDFLAKNTSVRVVCYFHWNYDLETLPFPMHRKLARDLIDAGVYAVVGNHSHVPQGGEIYKGKPIIYGFGNFYIPSKKFFNGDLDYPNSSKITMALEIGEDNNDYTCHWFATDQECELKYICSESLAEGEMVSKYSPYRDISLENYTKYFLKNRKKSLLVPKFESYKGIRNYIDEELAILRIKLIKLIKR